MAGNIKADRRIYRTTDGQLVRENDPRGAYLAYAVGDDVADGEADAYRALVDGDAAEHEVPGLMHDRLATQIADAQRVIANAPGSPAADVAADRIAAAADQVDAGSIPPPPGRDHTSPVAIVREFAASGDGQDTGQPAAKGRRRADTKATAKPADKAVDKPADKASGN
ncbi:hypothetical protein OOK41_31645 [Micromonospora sp. NBC_01655]|uniref:hypothetical protein n=1 Tax=Micromonospora sp. NBC_01655 TaxID=2975983 RepID=UPI002258176F|nr:hypothetical protein [Micromonospora sp. NBC_01655]MCX4474816.1 hypothetical protein [Micromonospora sp. NBC_01655]